MLKTFSLPFDEKYLICINAFHPAVGNHLFNEPAYFQLHSISPRDVYAQLSRRSDSKVVATIAFYETGKNTFISPQRGTFGGLSLNHPLDFPLLEQFLSTLIDYLIQDGAAKITLRSAPASHDMPLFSVLLNVLLRREFLVETQEVNYDMVVDQRAFIERIDHGNVKRIRKTLREGFVAEKIDSRFYAEVYSVIEASRKRLGLEVTLSAVQLAQMIELFPEKMHFFAVYRSADKQEMVAAAVCIALTESIFYVFYWGDIDGMSVYSPIALLASNIYGFCQESGFTLLDVGISTVGGIPNYGLIKFKRNLGFSESTKISFSLQTDTM